MSDDDQNGSDPNPGKGLPLGPGAGKSLILRMFCEQVRKQLKELGVTGPCTLKIHPAEYADVFTGDAGVEIGPMLEAANEMLEAEGHPVILIFDEVDDLKRKETDDEEDENEDENES